MPTDPRHRQPRKILVTGAAGFIGSNLVHWILEHWANAEVISLDALTYAGNLANLEDLRDHPRHSFVRANICDRAFVAKVIDDGLDAIINAAAHTHVDRSLMAADEFVTTNVGGVQVLLDLVKQSPEIRFLQVSTDEVYGSQAPDERADESDELCPNSPYAATKAGGDLLALAYCRSFGLNIVVTRCCNNYGPHQYPEKVIPLFISNLLDGKKVPLYGDGLHVREWIHVEDHSAAIARVLEAGRSGEVYHISSKNSLTNLELTQAILENLGKDESFIEYVTDRPGHDRRYALDDSKIRSELGWRSTVDFRQGLQETIAWYRANEDWWRPIKSGEYRASHEGRYSGRETS